ncbi:sensor histidine kinase [Cohnella soli]|uniref:Sensor histidine kinase n=1 Tax=Cohnella soli TaxID=425005 RepID=A0ABW0HZV0_9BACL
MRLFVQNNGPSIYMKLLLSFLIVLIPVYAVAIIANYDGAQKVKTEIKKTISSKVNDYLRTFDSEMARVISLRNEYILDKDLQDISVLSTVMTPFQFSQSVSRIMDRLQVLKTSSLYVEDAEVSIPQLNRTLSTLTYENSIDETALSISNGILDNSIIEASGEYYIYGSYPVSLPKGVMPLYGVKIKLSKEKIDQSLSEMVSRLGGWAVLFDSSQNWRLYSRQKEDMLSKFQPYMDTFTAGEEQEMSKMLTVGGVNYFVFMERSAKSDVSLLFYIQEDEILGPLKMNRAWLILLSIVSVLVVALFAYWIHMLIRRPIRIMVQALRNVENGRTGIPIQYRFKDEFNYMYNQFNAMTNQLDILIHEVYEQQIRTQKAELKQLQSQINPHFLYNSYFLLSRMVHLKEFEHVARLSKHLGEYFKFITRNDRDEVSLLEEWQHTLAYIEIQMYRYKRRMKTRYEPLLPEFHHERVPRIILQPIMENAYEHGLSNKAADGVITLSFVETDGALTIRIEDNGDELTDVQILQLQKKLNGYDEAIETTGLINVHKRLQLMFGEKHGLQVSRAAIGGLRVQISIPVQGGRYDV